LKSLAQLGGLALVSGGNLYFFSDSSRHWNRVSELTHTFQVSFDCLLNQESGFIEGGRRTDASRQIGYMGAIARGCWRIQYGVLHFFNPACFRIAFCVPGSRSCEG